MFLNFFIVVELLLLTEVILGNPVHKLKEDHDQDKPEEDHDQKYKPEEYHDQKFEFNEGPEFYEGDIVLTASQRAYRDQHEKLDDSQSVTRAITSIKKKLWLDGVVYYSIDSSLVPEAQNRLTDAIADWEKHTCIRFKKRTNQKDYVDVGLRGGCWSRFGRIGGKQEISVGDSYQMCPTGSITHELAHALGFAHEHTRPDRDQYIEILFDRIRRDRRDQFKKKEDIDSLNIPYDYGSIMHYPKSAFSLRPGDVTIKVKDPNADIGQRKGLSMLDIKQANLLYQCKDNPGISVPEPVKKRKTLRFGSSKEADDFCKGKTGNFSNPGILRSYIRCGRGRNIVTLCPRMQMFHPQKKKCMPMPRRMDYER